MRQGELALFSMLNSILRHTQMPINTLRTTNLNAFSSLPSSPIRPRLLLLTTRSKLLCRLNLSPVPPSPPSNLPSSNSLFAANANCRRSIFAIYSSVRCSRVEIAGSSSDAREACAVEREDEGVSSKCCETHVLAAAHHIFADIWRRKVAKMRFG
jgi:hypothetical protein